MIGDAFDDGTDEYESSESSCARDACARGTVEGPVDTSAPLLPAAVGARAAGEAAVVKSAVGLSALAGFLIARRHLESMKRQWESQCAQ